MSEFKDLKLTQLVASSTNPRSEFEENSLIELANSIKVHGVLQPIIVRVHPDDSKKHEVVAGERRFRASVIAKMKTIPASIRELNDDEVFEIQIIENLERKDVHPMDEAFAFQRMLDSGKYAMEDIAAKVAKNVTFVAQRLKLNDLIPELNEEFLKGEFGIGHAVLLCRVSLEKQNEIFQSSKDKWNPGYGTVKDIREELEDDELDLTDAPFDIDDSELLPSAGACINCPKNSLANRVLFPEYETNVCFDSVCFAEKSKIANAAKLVKVIEENPGITLICRYPQNDGCKHQIELAESLGKNVLCGYGNFYNSFDDAENAIDAYEVEDMVLNKIRLPEGTSSENSNTPAETNIKQEISNIKQRADRALELDREKIYIRAIKEIKENPEKNEVLFNTDPLEVSEKKALVLAIISYADDRWMEELYGETLGYNDRHHQIDKIFSEEFFNKVIRHYIHRTLVTESIADYGKQDRPAYMHAIFSHYFPSEIELFTLEQNAIAEKRIEKSNKRIEVLQNELDGKIDSIKRCSNCKKSDTDFIEEFDYPMMWKEDLCTPCFTKS